MGSEGLTVRAAVHAANSQKMMWREDNRRVSNGELYLMAANAGLKHPVSGQSSICPRMWCLYPVLDFIYFSIFFNPSLAAASSTFVRSLNAVFCNVGNWLVA